MALSVEKIFTGTFADRLVHAGIGLVAGLLLYVLFEATRGGTGAMPGLQTLQLAVSIAALGALMSYRPDSRLPAAIFALVMAVVLGLEFYYLLTLFTDADAAPSAVFSSDPGRLQAGLAFAAAGLVISYVALAFFQTWQETRDGSFPYEQLFSHAWTNALLVGVAVLFTGAVWAVLGLWAGLFQLVNLHFFKDLFTARSFGYLFTGAAFGLSIALAKEYHRIILALRGLALTLCRFLAPILAVAAILFLVVLPFTGLAPLWKTGAATPILLSVSAAGILFVNAVVQYGQEESGFPLWAKYPVAAQMALLPIFAVLAFYSTWLRIHQYGLTPQRVYAMLLIVIVGVHAVTYSYSVLRYRMAWGESLVRLNPNLARISVLLALLVHLPLIDPYHLSARDQFSRLAHGTIKVADFDFGAMKFHFGDPGRAMLAHIETDQTLPYRVAIDEKLAVLKEAKTYYDWEAGNRAAAQAATVDADLDSHFFVHPDKASLPEGLLAYMIQRQGALMTICGRDGRTRCALVTLDANQDGQMDYLLVRIDQTYTFANLFYRSADGWRMLAQGSRALGDGEAASLVAALSKGEFTLEAPRFQDIRIGNTVFGAQGN